MPLTGERKREFQRNWIRQRRDSWINENGPCRSCGSTENLEIDHIIPRSIAGGMKPWLIWSRREDIRLAELTKCQVLCEGCHKKKTFLELATTQHGTTMYKRCKCEVCRKAKRDERRKQRARRKNLTGVEEFGRPRGAHNAEIAGSNPAPGT